jgi:hypothetical protein
LKIPQVHDLIWEIYLRQVHVKCILKSLKFKYRAGYNLLQLIYIHVCMY